MPHQAPALITHHGEIDGVPYVIRKDRNGHLAMSPRVRADHSTWLEAELSGQPLTAVTLQPGALHGS